MSVTTHSFAPLYRRGISDLAIKQCGVRLGVAYCPVAGRERPAFLFPVQDATTATVGHKAMYADGDKPKERWIGNKAAHAPQCVAGLTTIIPGGTALALEGEKDLLLAASLDLPAFSLLCGVAAPSDYALACLKDRRPGRVVVVYDHDDAGRTGAVGTADRPGMVQRLRGADIATHAIRLPAEVGEHGDFTDLYRLCDFDRTTFLAALAACPLLPLPEPRRRPERRAGASPWPNRSGRREDFNAAHPLADLIEQHGVTLRRQGTWLMGLCPFHAEDHPSFGVNARTDTWRCFGACQTGGDAYWFSYLMDHGAQSARRSA